MSEDIKMLLVYFIALVVMCVLVSVFVAKGWSYATRAELWELERRIDVLESR